MAPSGETDSPSAIGHQPAHGTQMTIDLGESRMKAGHQLSDPRSCFLARFRKTKKGRSVIEEVCKV